MHARRAIPWPSLIVLVVAACAPTVSAPTSPGTPAPEPGVILQPECDDTGGCGEGFVLGQRAYALVCVEVKPELVNSLVVGRGEGSYREARPIEGLPTTRWLAVRGDLICMEGVDPAHEWFLAEEQSTGLTPADVAKLREVILP